MPGAAETDGEAGAPRGMAAVLREARVQPVGRAELAEVQLEERITAVVLKRLGAEVDAGVQQDPRGTAPGLETAVTAA